MKEPTDTEIFEYFEKAGGLFATVRHFLALAKHHSKKMEETMSRPSDEEIRYKWNSLNQNDDPEYQNAIDLANWAMDQIQFDQCYQEPKMKGVLTLEEIKDNISNSVCSSSDGAVHRAMRLARQGMIPAANAIEIPDESEWPKDALSIQIMYCYKIPEPHEKIHRCPNLLIKEIPRSKSVWKPLDSDTIVVWDSVDDNCRTTGIYLYGDIDVTGKHCAKVEQLSDIGHDIAWFKANRPWV